MEIQVFFGYLTGIFPVKCPSPGLDPGQKFSSATSSANQH